MDAEVLLSLSQNRKCLCKQTWVRAEIKGLSGLAGNRESHSDFSGCTPHTSRTREAKTSKQVNVDNVDY